MNEMVPDFSDNLYDSILIIVRVVRFPRIEMLDKAILSAVA
jgi:hypothetical protein